MSWFAAALVRLVSLTLGLNLVLYLVQQALGWSNDLRSIGGAALIILGAFFVVGGSGGHLGQQARGRALTEHDTNLYSEDRRKSFGAGVTLAIVGAVTLGLAILFP